MKKLLLSAAALLVAVATFTAVTNAWVISSATPYIITSVEGIPINDVAIVLGTSPSGPRGRENPFFTGRIESAASLYRAGKVRHLLVSGDNSRKDYDEPTAMRDALVALGVPADAVTLDYAGFRTLDTMARARAVFGLRKVTIVTDDFHQPRAVFLARHHGLEAAGVPSRYVPRKWSKLVRIREAGSRVKAWLDVYVLKTEPKFYGPEVRLPIGRSAGA